MDRLFVRPRAPYVECRVWCDLADAAIAALEAEVERREVCGNCKHMGRMFCLYPEDEPEAPWDGTVRRGQQCRFTPSLTITVLR